MAKPTEKTETNPKGAGRQRKEINEEELYKLLVIQCTEEECAFFFDCSVDTISRWVEREKGVKFAVFASKLRGMGKINVRRALFQQINKGHPRLIEFACRTILGMNEDNAKNYENQYEHPETVIKAPEPETDLPTEPEKT